MRFSNFRDQVSTPSSIIKRYKGTSGGHYPKYLAHPLKTLCTTFKCNISKMVKDLPKIFWKYVGNTRATSLISTLRTPGFPTQFSLNSMILSSLHVLSGVITSHSAKINCSLRLPGGSTKTNLPDRLIWIPRNFNLRSNSTATPSYYPRGVIMLT